MLRHFRKIVVREHWDMAEQVVKAVRRLEIIELVSGPNEIADREDAAGQHREKDLVRHKPRHRDRAPARPRLQDCVQLAELRDPGVGEPQQVDPVHERRDDPAAQKIDLAREQQVPDLMVLVCECLPALRDKVILPSPERLVPGDRLLEHWSVPSLGAWWFGAGATKNPPSWPLAGREAGICR